MPRKTDDYVILLIGFDMILMMIYFIVTDSAETGPFQMIFSILIVITIAVLLDKIGRDKI